MYGHNTFTVCTNCTIHVESTNERLFIKCINYHLPINIIRICIDFSAFFWLNVRKSAQENRSTLTHKRIVPKRLARHKIDATGRWRLKLMFTTIAKMTVDYGTGSGHDAIELTGEAYRCQVEYDNRRTTKYGVIIIMIYVHWIRNWWID